MRNIVCYIFLARFYGIVGQTISAGVGGSVCHGGASTMDVVHGHCSGQQTSTSHLVRIKPNKVGEAVEIVIGGRKLKRYTRAIQPPVYEIPDFLTDEECDTIKRTAQSKGLNTSIVFDTAADMAKDIQEKDLKDIMRVSNTTFLYYKGAALTNVRNKVVELTGLPKDIVFQSEPLQVLRYGVGGHYHGHWDSQNARPNKFFADASDRTCCHQSMSCSKTRPLPNCCRLCRFATVVFYLNDVEQGGETAFPWALLNHEDKLPLDVNRTITNLSYHCESANLVVKPRRGTAVLWYTHFIDKEGWMGEIDPASLHGGCDIIKGEKWIANTWINAPEYNDRFLPTIWKNK